MLAPIQRGQSFDADYFIETHPRWEGADAVSCYRAWLLDHVHEPISAEAKLTALRLPATAFPEAFPWQSYASIKPAIAANRWLALEHFINKGFRDFGETLTYGDGAQEFLINLALQYSERDDRLAIKAFSLALNLAPFSSPELNQHVADAYLRSNHLAAAKAIYQDLVDKGQANAWTVRNLYFSSVAMDQGACALHALLNTAATLRNEPIWRKTADEVIQIYFDAGLKKARTLYSQDQQAAAVSSIIDTVEQVGALLSLLSDQVEKTDRAGSRVILFVGQEDPAITFYRIEQKAALIESAGGSLTIIRREAGDLGLLLADTCAAIFLDMAATPQSLDWLQKVRRAGVPTFYEAYSPAFDPSLAPPPIETFAGFMTGALHLDLQIDVGLRRAFAGMCEFGIAPTQSIARRLETVTQKPLCWVLPDGSLDSVESTRNEASPGNKAVTFFLESPRFLYLTPSDQSFGSAIFECLSQFEDARFIAAGYVRLDARFDLFDDRIIEFGQIDVPGGHLAKISGPVINLAPTVDPGDDVASNASWSRAAQYAFPSVTDASGAAAAGARHNVDALIAHSPSEWLPNLIRLVGNSKLQSKIGERAYARAIDQRDPKKAAKSATAIFFQGGDLTPYDFAKSQDSRVI